MRRVLRASPSATHMCTVWGGGAVTTTTPKRSIGHRMVEPLHRRSSTIELETADTLPPPPDSRDREKYEKDSSFPVKFRDPAVHHGLTGDARRMAAEADEEYEQFEARHEQMRRRWSEEQGSGDEDLPGRIAAPFMERMVPSYEEGKAHRGMAGELSRPQDKHWEHSAHSELCRRTENQLAELIESGLPHEEKTAQVLQLMSGAMSSGVYLQQGTFEDVSSLLMTTPSLAGGATPFPHTPALLQMFRYMKSTFTAPSATIMEHCMVALARQPGEDDATLHSATRLLLDADKYMILPSRVAITAYFDVCCTNQAMDLAITRYADVVKHLGITADSGMVTSLVRGMNKQGMIEEAIAFSSHVEHVRIDTPMMNAMLESFLLSSDPEATFAGYKALAGSTDVCLPDSDTFNTLLMACEALDDWHHIKMVLHEMQRLRVRGEPETLNMLLRGLLKSKLEQYAEQLFLSMVDKGVGVWPELEAALPEAIRSSGAEIRKASSIIGHMRMSTMDGGGGEGGVDGGMPRADDEPLMASGGGKQPPLSEHTIGVDTSMTRHSAADSNAADDAELEALLSIEPSPRMAVPEGSVMQPTVAASDADGFDDEIDDEDDAAAAAGTGEFTGNNDEHPSKAHNPRERRMHTPFRQQQKLVPKSTQHLKQLAAKRKLHDVETEYLRSYLIASGAVAQSQVSTIRSKSKLVALTHKEIFGVWPAYESGSIVGGEGSGGGSDNGRQRRSGHRPNVSPKKAAAMKRRDRHRSNDDF